MFLVGKIIGTHGIKGEIKIKSDTSFDRFVEGNVLFVEKEKNEYKKIIVNSHRVHKGYDLITFNGFDNINQVLEYVGKNIYVDMHDRKKDNVNVYYEDLIGCEVIDEENNIIGVVNDIIELPKGILLETINVKTKALIPYVNDFILKVDIENKKIFVHLIEGLVLWLLIYSPSFLKCLKEY